MQANSFGCRRIVTHVLIGGLVGLFFLGSGQIFPDGRRNELLIIVLGYISLCLICLSLLIGPLNLLRQRRNPVNINLRRDLGIWAGITGCWHVLLVLRGIVPNGEFLLYFLRRSSDGGYAFLLSIFGLSNDTGLLAVLLLIVLFVLSNTLTLRWLKGKRWKRIQRLTYLLALLAVAHTIGYQVLNLRGPLLIDAVSVLVGLVCLGQGCGIALMRSRQKPRA